MVSLEPLLHGRNQPTKSSRQEEVKGQFLFLFMSLCPGGSFLVPRGEPSPVPFPRHIRAKPPERSHDPRQHPVF